MGNLINKKMNLNKRKDKLQQREKENAQAEKLVLSVRKFELYSEFLVKEHGCKFAVIETANLAKVIV